MSNLANPTPQRPIVFKHSTGHKRRWFAVAGFTLFIAPIIMLALPESLFKGVVANTLGTAYILLGLHTLIYLAYVTRKERALVVAAASETADVQYLPMYILAFTEDGEKVHDRSGRILCDLFSRMSDTELASLPEILWDKLCPSTDIGRAARNRESRDDEVYVAILSAITRLEYTRLRPCIAYWMENLDPNCHSPAYVHALTECHKAIRNMPYISDEFETLLRASSAEAAPNVLLRPISGTYLSRSDTGELLLRATEGAEKGAAK